MVFTILGLNSLQMIRYISSKQLSIEEFKTPFESHLNPDNKWVKLANLIPWDEFVAIYTKPMSKKMGRPSIPPRVAVAAMIIKHMEKLDDRGVVNALEENIYMQYFSGLSSFCTKCPFDPSLLVEMRIRMGAKAFDEMSKLIIKQAIPFVDKIAAEKFNKSTKQKSDKNNIHPGNDENITIDNSNVDSTLVEENNNAEIIPNKGTLKIDATVADQFIQYPTDIGLLNKTREISENLIDEICTHASVKVKPRTYRVVARKEYLSLAVKKNKTRKQIRVIIGKQLRYIKRNLSTITKLLDQFDRMPLCFKSLRRYWVIQHIYEQQRSMFVNKVFTHTDRIVNIYQPYVRPIPRGKDKHSVEFGAKLGVSEFNGFSIIDRISWNAYSESNDLILQVENYKKLFGYYPELVLADGAYMGKTNREFLSENNIRHAGKKMGRPKKMATAEKIQLKKERGERNHVEGKFGQAKNGYRLKEIRARRADTSESWISGIWLALNLVRLLKITPLWLIGILLMSKFFINALFMSLWHLVDGMRNVKLHSVARSNLRYGQYTWGYPSFNLS